MEWVGWGTRWLLVVVLPWHTTLSWVRLRCTYAPVWLHLINNLFSLRLIQFTVSSQIQAVWGIHRTNSYNVQHRPIRRNDVKGHYQSTDVSMGHSFLQFCTSVTTCFQSNLTRQLKHLVKEPFRLENHYQFTNSPLTLGTVYFMKLH